MKLKVPFCGLILFIAIIASPILAQAIQPALSRCDDASIEIEGPVARMADAVVQNWLLTAPGKNPAIIQMFAVRDQQPYRDLLPWSGEFAGKFITGSVQMARLTGSDELRKSTGKLVNDLIAQQAADGYLGPFPENCRLTGTAPNVGGNSNWDAWGHYHAMLGLLLWHEDTGDEQALRSAQRIGDLLCEKFPENGTPVSVMGSLEMNQAVAHSMALLHQQTGDEKYLQFAKRVVKDFEAPSAGDYFRQGLQNVEFFRTPKPRWESLHPIMALAELYWITGDKDDRTAFENLWWSIAKLDRHNNGGFSSGEQAQGNPYHQGAIETCCTVAWIAMSVEMLRLTGDPRVADELELSTLNQIMGTYDPSGKWSTYNTPMDGRRVPSTTDIAFQIRPGSEELNCCSVNAARGFGMITDWALMRDPQGNLALNWYGPSEMQTTVGKVPVTIRQKTTYPFEGHIVVDVAPEQPTEFTLKLRIPHWSKSSLAFLNGKTLTAKPGTYLELKREWRAGDQVKLSFDTSFRYWVGENECAGKASIYRGPLLLAYEGGVPPKVTPLGKWTDSPALHATKTTGDSVTAEIEGDSVMWTGFLYDDAGRARVIIDGKEVDVVDQYGPTRETPFQWTRSGLGQGKHEVRIEATGQKSPESKGTWINYARINAGIGLPVIDVTKLSSTAEPGSGDSTMLKVMIHDASGKTIHLRDFASAGQAGKQYWSWLPITGIVGAEFSKENPSRTSRP